MSARTHLCRRGGIYHFRLRLPKQIVQLMGRKELRRSLRTRDPLVARRRWLAALRLAELTIARLQTTPMLTDQEIEQIAREFYETELAYLEESRFYMTEWLAQHEAIAAEAAAAGIPEPIPPEHDQSNQEQLRSDLAMGRNGVAVWAMIQNGKVDLDPDDPTDPQFRWLCRYILRALVELAERDKEHAAGQYYGEPKDPLFRKAVPLNGAFAAVPAAPDPFAGLSRNSRLPISKAIELFLEEATDLPPKTKDDFARSVGLFVRLVADRPIGLVTRDDVVDYRNQLKKLPKNYQSELKTDDPAKAIELNEMRKKEKKKDKPVISDDTIDNKYLTNLRSFFNWALEYKMLRDNPATGVRASRRGGKKGSKKKKKARVPFTIGELRAIFGAPLYAGCKSKKLVFEAGKADVRDHRFWSPLLALFTGCRLNEIGQLEVQDIAEIAGHAHLRVTTTSDVEDGDADDGDALPEKRIKTGSAERDVPLHPELIRIGFLRYVEDQKRTGQRRVFPDWNPASDGYYSSTFSKWFARFLNKHGLKRRDLCFHSFRHGYKDALKSAGIEPETRKRVMGHATEDVHEKYGSGTLLPKEIKQVLAIEFPGLDLSHLSYR
jgi:integrase